MLRPFRHCSAVSVLLVALGLTLSHAATITVQDTIVGTTPSAIGYNLGHFMAGSNAADWWRYTGVRAARVFLSVSDIEPTDDLPGTGDGVNSEAAFQQRRNAVRANYSDPTQALNAAYINWNAFEAAYATVATGNNRFAVSDAFPVLRSQGVEILVNLTASPSRFPLAGPTDWPNVWELWQHYYAEAAWLASHYQVRRFGMFNEPNNWTPAISVEDWHLRLQICADAIRAGVEDVNRRHGSTLVAEIFAPNTANGSTKYNDYTGGDYWGQHAVLNRHLPFLGTAGDPGWWNFDVYNWQKYSMYTQDTGTSSGYRDDFQLLASLIAADMPGETPFPKALTEYNVRTGASYDGRRETLDSPSDFVALAANSIVLTEVGADQLYLFKFGQTARTTGYLVAKNGTHPVNNDTSGLNNYGGITKGGEAFRLFHRAAGTGRPRLGTISTAGTGVWILATREPGPDTVRLLVANQNTSAVALDFDLSGLGLPEGSLVLVEEVSGNGGQGGGTDQRATAGHGGAVVRRTALSAGLIPSASLPAQGVWLVSIHPGLSAGPETIPATADAVLADGTNRNQTGGTGTVLSVRSDGTANNRRAAVLRFSAPTLAPGGAERVILAVTGSTLASANPSQVHVYGLNDDAWSEATVTWATLTSGLRQNVASGRQIAHNVVAGQGTTTRILGQWWASSTTYGELALDVTDFVREQTDGAVSFLLVQDHRWDYTLDSTSSPTVGDLQPDGLRLVSREGATPGSPGPRLLVHRPAGSTPPVITSQPASLTVTAGQPASFTVQAAGTPPLAYQWRRNGVDLAGAQSDTFLLAATVSADAGSYDCVVSNPVGSVTSQAAILTVNLPPAANPVFTPNGGTFSSPPTVTLSCATAGASIRYTTDGSTPSPTAGTLYAGPFTLGATATVRAIAYASGWANSQITSATFTLATAAPITAEFEKLTVAASSGSSVAIKSDSQASGGKTVLYRSTANGQFITFALSVPAPGTYGIQISAKRMSDRGIFQLAVADSLAGSYANVDTPKDEYTKSITFGNIPAFTSPVTFTTPGTKYLRFTVTGKNTASSDRNLNFDRIVLTPQ